MALDTESTPALLAETSLAPDRVAALSGRVRSDSTDAIADAAGHRAVSVPGTKPIAKRLLAAAATRGIPADPATIDYLDHPTRYACPNTRRALAGTGIECPTFESYVDDLVAFVRENPNIGDEAMV